MEEKQLTGRELEEQANALLAEADFEEIKLPKKVKKAAAAKKAEQENEQAEKPAEKFPPLDEKLIASLPAAALLQGNEKLMEIFAKGKAKGKLSSSDLMETIDEMNLESEQLSRTGQTNIPALAEFFTQEEINHLIGILQKPESVKNGAQALRDYSAIILEQARKRAAADEDPLAAAMEKNKYKGNGGKHPWKKNS